MSYAPVYAFSGFGPWGRNIVETDEAYIWRGRSKGAAIRTLEDMQVVAKSAALSQNWGFELKGVAVRPVGEEQYQIDAVYTSKVPNIWGPIDQNITFDDAKDVAGKMEDNLSSRFGSVKVVDPELLQIDDNDPQHPALDFWISHSTIYEHPLVGGAFPTKAFDRFEGLYRGSADEGITLKKWTNPTGQPPGPGGGGNGEEDSTLMWVALGGLALYLAYQVGKVD